MADRLDYSGYDFDTALDQLEAKLELQDGWKDRVKSATGQIFIRLMAYVIDMDGFKIDRRAEEGYRDFARLRSSIVAIAANLGYPPRRKVSSVCTLKFSSSSAPVVIPLGTVCQTDGGVKFVTVEQGTITIPGGNIELLAKQGDPKVITQVADGSSAQSYSIPAAGDDVEAVENESVVVSVDGVKWTLVDTFINQVSDAEIYTIVRKKTDLQIQFGDDKNGKIPGSGLDVDLEWLETLGAAGDVPGENTITTISPSIPNVTVTNKESAQGGEEEEDIEEIRVNMSQIFATGERIVTNPDYRAILLAYPGVAKANSYGEQEVLAAGTNPDYAWRVELVVVPSGGGTLTRTQENQIMAFLAEKKVNTTWITFEDPTYIPVDFSVHATLSEDADIEATVLAIEAALDAVINFVDIDLGEAFRFNDAVAAVEAVEGVRYSTVEALATHYVADGDGSTGPYASSDDEIDPIPVVPVDRGNVLVYLEEIATGIQRRVGYDNGLGFLQSDTLVDVPKVDTGTVNYEDGSYSILFNGGVQTTYKIILKYQTGIEKSKVFGVGDGAEVTFTGVLERNLSPGFVKIYKEGIQVGEDDGAGNITDIGGGTGTVINDGSVNYVTGDIQVEFATPAPDDELEISAVFHYEFPDIEVGIAQMLLMGNKDVTTEVRA